MAGASTNPLGGAVKAGAAPDRSVWRGRPLEDRFRHIKEDIFILHPVFEEVWAATYERALQCRSEGFGEGIHIVCNTGGGKTTLVKYAHKQLPDIPFPERTVRQVVSFRVPKTINPLRMAQAALNALGDPDWDAKDVERQTGRLVTLLQKAGTLMVLVDNAHDIPEKRGHGMVRDVGIWARDLMDDAKLLFVWLGTDAVTRLPYVNPQLRSRGSSHFTIPYFGFMDAVTLSRLMRYLEEMDQQWPMAEESDFASNRRARQIGMATNGVPRMIRRLLTRALTLAVGECRESITDGDLSLAFGNLFAGYVGSNPFAPDTKIRLLNQPGEPFADWLEGLEQIRRRQRKDDAARNDAA